MKGPLISVIIPNYNYGRYLTDSIESVLNQTYKNIQLIVVDNGSTDNSVVIASNYSNSLTLIEKEHGGVSSARNFGLLHAKGEYVCFLDSDVSWLPDNL
jgi:glycosyltransferase involved in cell wall biosynthesis